MQTGLQAQERRSARTLASPYKNRQVLRHVAHASLSSTDGPHPSSLFQCFAADYCGTDEAGESICVCTRSRTAAAWTKITTCKRPAASGACASVQELEPEKVTEKTLVDSEAVVCLLDGVAALEDAAGQGHALAGGVFIAGCVALS
jgi:hypothetical protein